MNRLLVSVLGSGLIGFITPFFGFGWISRDFSFNPKGAALNLALVIFWCLVVRLISERNEDA